MKARKSYRVNALKMCGPIEVVLTPRIFLTIESNCGFSHSISNYDLHILLFQMT